MQSQLNVSDMCSVDSCKAVMTMISNYSPCVLRNGIQNVAYACPVPTTPPTPTKDSTSSHVGVFVGIGCAVILILGIIIYCLIKRPRSRSKDPVVHYPEYPTETQADYAGYINRSPTKYGEDDLRTESTNARTANTRSSSEAGLSSSFPNNNSYGDSSGVLDDLAAWRINPTAITLKTMLGRGAFGEVWLATYMSRNVAVKKLLNYRKTANDVKKFAMEIQLVAKYVFEILYL